MSPTQMKNMQLPLLLGAALVLACCAQPPEEGPLRMEVRALGSGSCTGNNASPFGTMTSGLVRVTGIDPVKETFGVLFENSFSVSGNQLSVPDVPQGNGHKVEFIGSGGGTTWYGSAPSVNVKAEGNAAVQLLLTQVGVSTQLPVVDPVTGSDLTSFSNVRFPAVAELGDGRVMISGGFESSSGTSLNAPSNKWFIVNPRTAELQTGTFDASFEGRGAHVAAYLPGTGQVLIAGGASSLDVVGDGSFPISWSKAGGSGFKNAALFTPPPEGSTEAGSWSFPANDMRVARVFARAVVTSDNLAIITGGGEWPLETDSDYQRTEVFDPETNEVNPQARFLNVASFDSFAPRSGHTLTNIKTENGLSYILVFGGTPSGTDASGTPRPVAELMRQSSQQQDGVDGNFAEIRIQGDTPKYLYFHETTRLSGERFLVTGGVEHAVDKLPDVSGSHAYLLTYSDEGGQAPTVTVRDLSADFPGGRVFHSALSADFNNVAILGGFGGGAAALDTNKVVFFDAESIAFQVPEDNGSFLARAGQGALAMTSGSMIIVGGEPTLNDVGAACGHVEIYTPSFVTN